MNKQGPNGIEYCDFTLNPIAGCYFRCEWNMPTGHTTCYAKRVAEGLARAAYPEGFEHIYYRLDKFEKTLESAPDGSRIFLGSMGDMFASAVAPWAIRSVLTICGEFPGLTFLTLTKNPSGMLDFDFPQNVWKGISLPPSTFKGHELTQAQQGKWFQSGLWHMIHIPGVRWVSLEPLSWDPSPMIKDAPIEWAVIGAASNGKALLQPDLDVLANTIMALRSHEIPIFYKGNIRPAVEALGLQWRQEFPS